MSGRECIPWVWCRGRYPAMRRVSTKRVGVEMRPAQEKMSPVGRLHRGTYSVDVDERTSREPAIDSRYHV